MKSNLLYKVFAVIVSIPLIALIFGGAVGSASDSSNTDSGAAYYESER
ncbi:MAG: hypothetical protein K2J77_02760 [Oscillospiraceae bacterium]|nr:hypothetical protein [Oscillospiraceae bacterium]